MGEAAVSLERAWLVLSGLKTSEAVRSYEHKIEDIFGRFLTKCKWMDFSLYSKPPPYLHREIARCLSEYLWTSKPRRFGESFLLADVVDAQLDPNVDRPVGTCIGLTALFSVLGLRAGLNMSLLVNSDHLLSRLRVGYQTIDIDQTDPLGFDCRSSEEFRELPLWTLTANVLNSRGLEHERGGRFQAARADYQKAIEVNPLYANAYNNRGNMKFREQDLDGAVADYTEAVRLNPCFLEAYCNRGMARQRLGRYDEARADYTRALNLDAGYDDARDCLNALDAVEFRETSAISGSPMAHLGERANALKGS
jgi:tetratricopeptide (TPR) repeat protein